MHIIDIVTLVMAGLMVGTELTVSAFINPVMRQLSAQSQAQALSLFAALLGRVMPFWYALCLLLLVVETVARRDQACFRLLLGVSVLWAAIIAFTIVALVPINNRIAALSTSKVPIERWLPEHDRWERLHRLRILLLLIALILATHALV
jgi:uncharacterized membrane protein